MRIIIGFALTSIHAHAWQCEGDREMRQATDGLLTVRIAHRGRGQLMIRPHLVSPARFLLFETILAQTAIHSVDSQLVGRKQLITLITAPLAGG
ncbi:hypothetical protein AB0M12_16195 [Nocardia vinacea]|uniref:hypothetical protein n=1 Tax=Nocardia vinacea TaxID=96468 RepID=UPI00341314FC